LAKVKGPAAVLGFPATGLRYWLLVAVALSSDPVFKAVPNPGWELLPNVAPVDRLTQLMPGGLLTASTAGTADSSRCHKCSVFASVV
jgi:hypothetical protein